MSRPRRGARACTHRLKSDPKGTSAIIELMGGRVRGLRSTRSANSISGSRRNNTASRAQRQVRRAADLAKWKPSASGHGRIDDADVWFAIEEEAERMREPRRQGRALITSERRSASGCKPEDICSG